jgi:RNA polymerase sigma-70 factor, ECF subfamily
MDESMNEVNWQRWLDDHAPRFLLFARQETRFEADAQDLVQEALVEAMQRKKEDGPPSPALVFATIHRRAIDWARHNQRRSQREVAAMGESPEAWFDASPEERELGRLMQEALGRVPEIHREVVTLKVWGGLTFAEIAEVLEVSANTAASRYRYGLEALRKITKEVLV